MGMSRRSVSQARTGVKSKFDPSPSPSLSLSLSKKMSSERDEEIEALSAIFGDDFHLTDPDRREFDVAVHLDDGQRLRLCCSLPEAYPSTPPVYDIGGDCLNGACKSVIRAEFEAMALQDSGSVIVFKWLDWLRDAVPDLIAQHQDPPQAAPAHQDPYPSGLSAPVQGHGARDDGLAAEDDDASIETSIMHEIRATQPETSESSSALDPAPESSLWSEFDLFDMLGDIWADLESKCSDSLLGMPMALGY